MNVVLYTDDFEPITVLDLPQWLLDQMEKQGAVRVAVLKPLSAEWKLNSAIPVGSVEGPQTVTIYCEKLRWKDGSVKSILITHDEELALMLKPEWLPGQRATINSYHRTVRMLTENLIKAMRK